MGEISTASNPDQNKRLTKPYKIMGHFTFA